MAQALEIVSGPASPAVPQVDQNIRDANEQARLAESRAGQERSLAEVDGIRNISAGADARLQERGTPEASIVVQDLVIASNSTVTSNSPDIERKEPDSVNPLVAGDDLELVFKSYKGQKGGDDAKPPPTPTVSVPPTADFPHQPVSGKKLLPKRKTEIKKDANKEDMPAPGED